MTPDFRPADQDQRDRIKHDLGTTLFVEAGAGTGKTTALVSRIVSLVKEGADISRIAAITFTLAAAAELRARVRKSLLQEADNLRDADQKLSDSCLVAALNIDRAYIQTLHSFASALLRERPLEAGLPPGFETVEEIEADINFQVVWQEWLDAVLNSPDLAAILTRAARVGLRLDNLKGIAGQFHANYDLLAAPFAIGTMPSATLINTYIDTASQLAGLVRYARNGESDPLATHCRQVCATAGRLKRCGLGSEEALAIMSNAGRISFGRGSKSNWDTDPASGVNACSLIKDALAECQEEVQSGMQKIRTDLLVRLLENLRLFILEYSKKRGSDGKAEFQDLLVWTRDLLRDDATVRHHFQRKFNHILIDEFQDTDPIQAEIAFLLAEHGSESGGMEKDWRKLDLEPGKLFVVGDPKQSIYRFRRADIATVETVKKLIIDHAAGDSAVPLSQNFRSQASILKWINTVFSNYMHNDGTGVQADYIALVPRPDIPVSVPLCGVHWFGGEVEAPADAIRHQEAEEIARAIKTMKSGVWQVRTEDGLGLTPAQYRDVCVLMPTRTGLISLERALARNQIPYRVEGQSLILGTEDVKELLSCLRAVDSPSDKIALVAALRSTAFTISDVELVEYLDNGGNLDYINPDSAGGRVREALEIIAKYHHDFRMGLSPAELIDKFVRERSLAEVCFGRTRPRERLRRLQFVIEQARAFSQVKESSLRSFLDWIERLAEDNTRLVEASVPETDEDAVRIMTIHAAKGLEFPITILTGLGFTGSSSESSRVYFDRTNGQTEVAIGPKSGIRFSTQGYEAIAELEQRAEDAEDVRLMYVAATRAKDHLVVSLYRKQRTEGNDKSFAGKLETICNDNQGLWEQLEFLPAGISTTITAEFESAEEDTEEHRAKWIKQRQQVIQLASKPDILAVTSITHDLPIGLSPEEIPHYHSRDGSNLGRAVHSVLQSIDLETGENLEELARTQATVEGIPSQVNRIVSLVQSALSSSIVKRVIESGKYHREVYVRLPISRGSVEGIIDLIFEENDQLVVVDYKTDAIVHPPSQEKIDQYSLQTGIYAFAVSKGSRKPVKEAVVLFLSSGYELIVPFSKEALNHAITKVESSFG